jgi:hypothetical protein
VRFEGVLESAGRGGGVLIRIPFDLREAFGGVRVPVRVRVNGYEFRTTTAVMGGKALIGLNKQVREGAGVAVGHRVEVELQRDEEPRTVEVPEAFASALAEAGLRVRFDRLSYTHRKEYVRWIEEAKREETRERRLAKAVEMLGQGIEHP